MNVTLTAVVLLTTAALCYAADAECKYRKSRKLALHWPDPTDCTRYYRCTNRSIKREVVCAEGKVYNSKTGKCSNNIEGLCKLTLAMPLDANINVCANETSGVYLDQPGYCRNFYICNQNEAYPQVCDAGSRFNSTTRTCIPDTDSECWQNKCIGENNGTYLPNESSCSSFYVCAAGETIEQECGSGSYFNSSKRICLPDPDGQFCWENLCVGKKDGEFVQNVKDCYSYYICVSAKPIQQYCPEGSYFNSTENSCLPGECSPVTTECPTTETTESTTECISESTESTPSTECTDATTPTTETTESTTECTSESTESKSSTECTEVTTPATESTESTTECISESTESTSSTECTEVTTSTTETTESTTECTSESTESTPSTECTEVTTHATEATCDCPGGYKEGELIPFPNYPENCDKYYECSNGKLEEKECGEGNGFNSTLGVCEPDVDHICWPVVTTECSEVTTPATEATCDCPGGYKEGELIPFPNYPENCDKYYECLNGKLEEKECGEGNGFNSTLGVCEPDVDHICWPVVTTECSEVTTPATEATCDCPGGYKEGELIPFPNYPENCDKYYECSNGKLVEKECGEGNSFNSTLGVCEPDVDHICWPIVTTECSEVTTPATEATCDCPGGYKEGELIPFPNYPENCDKYYECSNGKLEEKECGEGNSFNSTLGVCEPDVDHICWPVVTTECSEVTTPATEATCDCPGGYKEGELIPFPNYPENCDKYYECSNGKLVEKECGEGNSFNSTLGVCEPDVDHICWPVVTTECSEVTTPATEATCDCPGGYKEGELIPFPNYPENCDKYYECSNGKLVEKECGEGNSFNNTLGVCEPDVDHICWPVVTTECSEVTTPATEATCDCPGGYKEGELIPFPNYPENCDKYYECSNGKLEEKECGEGNGFNSTLGVCEPDVDHICWPVVTTECSEVTTPATEATCDCPGGYKEGELIPFPNYPENCDKYYECLNGKLEEKECGEGNGFNSTLGVCEPDVDHICWPVVTTECSEVTTPATEATCDCPGGYKEGELIPFPNYPENCDKYYECSNGKLVEKECGEGNSFNSTLGVCQPDIENVCSRINCDARSYNVIGRRNRRSVDRSPIDTFDAPLCLGLYAEGEIIGDSSNCRRYQICVNGEMISEDCGFGNYFNSNTLTCNIDIQQVCIGNNENVNEYLSTKKSEEITDTISNIGVEDCSCPGGYKEGELLPFPNYPENCDKYYICTDGRLQERECGEGNYFDSQLGVCVPDVDNKCWPAETNCTCPGGYKEGELLPFPNYPENCDKYYICTDGRLQERECGEGNYFDSQLGVCVPDVDNKCWPAETNCTCPGGYKEGELLPFPNYPENCDKYYICTDGRLQERECGEGNYFDSQLGVCVPDVDNTCWPNVCYGQIDGTYVPDSTNCTSFYLCQDGKGEIYNCPPEKWFNPVDKICMPDFNATCINPCKDTTGITFLPNPDCSKYFLCNDCKPYVETCPEGGFDITLNKCHADAVCEATLCVGKSDGTTYPFVGNDTKFYLCMGGVAQIRECKSGQIFNKDVGVCLEEPSSQCNQTECQSTNPEENAFAPLTNTDNTAFCLCRGDSAFLHHCAVNYTFRADLGICYSNAPCDPELCDSFPENTRSQNRNNSHSFCLCVSKQQVIVDCPNNQTYNAVTQTCQVLDERCSSTFCLTAPEYSTFPALNNDTDGFCECISSGTTYKLCGNDKKYNAEKGICLPEIGDDCSSSLCSGNAGLIFGAASDPHSFCYCINDGLAIKQNCPNSEIFNETLLICQAVGCDGEICLTNPSGAFPALNEPYAFCVCGSSDPSSVTKHDCANGTRFDPYYLFCKEDPCDKSFCSNSSNNGIPYPANNYQYGYCVCKSGIPELVSCSDGNLFNPVSRQCESSSTVECDVAQCANTTSEYPFAIAAKNDTHGFCYCFSSTEVEFFLCPDNALFDPISEICNISCTKSAKLLELNQGISTVSCLGTYGEGEYVPHRTNNQLFYVCYNAKLLEGDCGAGNIFDQDSLTCQPLDKRVMHQNKSIMRMGEIPENNKWCIENEKRSVLFNCSQYEVCIDGDWTRLSCPDRQIFSNEERGCIELRDDMICIYGRVTSFPNCSTSMELHTVPGKDANCTQYYRCNHGKWRLKNCPKQHFYSKRLNTCIPSSHDDVCTAENELNIDIIPVQEFDCRHMEVRYYESNCAMYLMCLDGKWWHHYCPLGMYYNRIYNYCMPDLDGRCSITTRPLISVYSEEEYSKQSCILEGALRPSALACDCYYVCQGSFWKLKICPFQQYFNLTKSICLPDIENICLQRYKPTCSEGERREFPFNCTSYEQCVHGEWQKQSCKFSFMFDNILQQCVPNNGECGENGLRKVCETGVVKAHPLSDNCTQFYYCLDGIWKEGFCLKAHTYSDDLGKCVPHAPLDKCQPFIVEKLMTDMNLDSGQSTFENNIYTICLGRENGSAVPHPESCLHFFVCLGEVPVIEQKCIRGSFFDATLGYCRPNNGSCIMPLAGVCANSTDGGNVAHPYDCQAYYECSTLNGTELRYCAEGEYYHNTTGECHIDRGECRAKFKEHSKCQHGKSLSHERYCNIYFACVRGLAIPAVCPAGNHFNSTVGHCVFDPINNCENGSLSEITYNIKSEDMCKNLSDGNHLPDMIDCTKYYVCLAGMELRKQCPSGAYFDTEQQLCVPDDGSCPYVVKTEPNFLIAPPEPSVCEGKHGDMLPDLLNCNEFYVCINGKLRHERCYTNYYFNSSILQCQSYTKAIGNTTEANAVGVDAHQIKLTQTQCKHKPSNYTELCLQMPKGSSIAEPGDCRRYVSCNDVDGPVSQRCRNGESYDSLLGFCRQNDGTCLLENGQRVGECNARHGVLVRDEDNCQAYFVCINGQKIPGSCKKNEYFDKIQTSCLPNENNQCGKALNQAYAMKTAVSCLGLGDSILYPYTLDNCRSYFQCVQGKPVVHKCADGLYFNASITRCVKDVVNCTMPAVLEDFQTKIKKLNTFLLTY